MTAVHRAFFPYLPAAACVMLRRTMSQQHQSDADPTLDTSLGGIEDERDPAPPQVFRSKVYRSAQAGEWIVEPPRDLLSAVGKMVFTGVQAQEQALTYAYETFGNARFFPY
jgi:hypothetical protein